MFSISKVPFNRKIFILLTVFFISLIFSLLPYIVYFKKYGLLCLIIFITIILYSVLNYSLEKILLILIFSSLSFDFSITIYSNYYIGGINTSIVINQLYLLTCFLFFINIIKGNFRFTLNLEMILLIGLLFLTLISAFYSLNKISPFYIVIRYFFVILFLFSILQKKTEEIWDLITIGLVINIILQTFIGFMQIYLDGPLGISFLGEDINPFRKGVDESERGISGTLGHPASYAFFLLLCIPIMIANTSKELNKKFHIKVLIMFSIILSTISIILSNARISIMLLIIIFL